MSTDNFKKTMKIMHGIVWKNHSLQYEDMSMLGY